MKKQKNQPAPKAERTVVMENVSSMECYLLADGESKRVIDGATLHVMRAESWGVSCDEPFEMELLMEIMGNVKPYESGRCSLSEMGMMRLKRRVVEHLYYINDQKLMYPHMHVLSWLMFATQRTAFSAASRQVEWLETLLELDLYHIALTYARFLTDAEHAAVALLLALKMPRVQLVLVDLSHIEVPQSLYRAFSGVVAKLQEQGKAVVIASAQRDLLQGCCTNAAFLLDGALELQGSVAELCRQHDRRRLVVRTGAPDAAVDVLTEAFPEMSALAREGEAWLCGDECPPVSDAASALERRGVAFDRIEIASPNLELAFREVFP